jgi:hypothetical protein
MLKRDGSGADLVVPLITLPCTRIRAHQVYMSIVEQHTLLVVGAQSLLTQRVSKLYRLRPKLQGKPGI